jgi:hypothetical protein
MSHTISNLLQTGVNMLASISPNINWNNSKSWHRTRQISNHIHISATSSNIGLEPEYIHKNLTGGTTIMTFGLWSSKVSQFSSDPDGYGSFSTTTIQGKGGKR